MEESNAIHKLTEAVDLIRMIEDLTSPTGIDRLSAGTLAGIRITLKNVREAVQLSHDTFAQHLVNRAKYSVEKNNTYTELTTPVTQIIEPEKNEPMSLTDTGFRPQNYQDGQKSVLIRRDLRASLEKLVDR